ncbi:hypothetical protein [Gordonia rubripertincta]|uniref:DUF4331 domain-containing protein n=1 Tax=Gordonia rubripertincta TaxID=36822 RepID=A0ABT4MYV8_GORRU|nr:hypothetical protein [Gordonia rubripertincta]MCZ4552193.1 hypothetical protein [Gordonia rubripertincta]
MAVAPEVDTLVFSFPEVHADAVLNVRFHRTLRVPDDETTYGLPPSLGTLALRSTDDPGEAMLPMWQSEATWISFSAPADYPFLIKIGVGGLNAITGEAYTATPNFDAEDYVETAEQPWLDGFRVDDTTVRQFVAMPLGAGYSVAEQLTGSDTGAVAFSVIPLKGDVWEQRPKVAEPAFMICPCPSPDAAMGLGAGGAITQSIATPIEPRENWSDATPSEASVRIVNSAVWQSITDESPHHQPLTIEDYLGRGYPWFEWYDDSLARQGQSPFAGVKTVNQVGDAKGEKPLPDNSSFTPPTPIVVGGS